MINKSKGLGIIYILVFIFCVAFGAIAAIDIMDNCYAASQIKVIQNEKVEVTYSAKSYIDNSGKFNNFSLEEGSFSNALYSALDIEIDGNLVVVDHEDITITNQMEIMIPKNYSLNLIIDYEGQRYTVNYVSLIVVEKTLENVPVIKQTDVVKYNGMSYINNGKLANLSDSEDVFINDIFSALSFEISNNVISIEPDEVFFYNSSNEKLESMIKPKKYNLNILFYYMNNSYFVKDVQIILEKSILNVTVELNGELNLEVKEGETYIPKIVYSGFLNDDNVEDDLIYLATIPNEPKRPINNYEIRAEGALSYYYEMNYISSYITITPNPMKRITYSTGGEDLVILLGNYSPYCELEFINVGVSEASVIYVEIKNLLEKFYENKGIFDDYKSIGSFRINLKVDEQKEELVESHISIKMDDKLKGYDKYYVVALSNDGVYHIVNATVEDDYLSFYTADLGDFVILAPIKGINTTQFFIIAFAIFGGLSLCILLFAVFRKKY
ncbi:MAG TPA: hypothetical protein VJ903_01430 [Clostridia bacterium]|nr:hypothetical protein [Clostridia bacterium]